MFLYAKCWQLLVIQMPEFQRICVHQSAALFSKKQTLNYLRYKYLIYLVETLYFSGHLVLNGNKITTLSSGYFVSLYYRVFFLRIVCIAAKEVAISAMYKIFVLLESDVSGVFGFSGGVGGLYMLVTSNPYFVLPVISVLQP